MNSTLVGPAFPAIRTGFTFPERTTDQKLGFKSSRARQILVIRQESVAVALLFFETQGVSSTLRFWAVSPRARSSGLGSTLLRRYLEMHPGVRRFVLWVDEANRNARDKYSRFGYSPDGLFDHILLSPGIRK